MILNHILVHHLQTSKCKLNVNLRLGVCQTHATDKDFHIAGCLMINVRGDQKISSLAFPYLQIYTLISSNDGTLQERRSKINNKQSSLKLRESSVYVESGLHV